MASLSESIPFDPDAGLRESFPYQLRAEELDILVPLVATVLMLAREGHCVDGGPRPPTISHVQAIAADLRFLEALLRHLTTYNDGASNYLWHARLVVQADNLAPRVGCLSGKFRRRSYPST